MYQDINPLTMSDKEIEEFNEKERKRMNDRIKEQGSAERIRKALAPRDTSITRGIKGEGRRVTCITKRKIGLDDPEQGTSEIGEEILLPRDIADKLQDAGAIKVKL